MPIDHERINRFLSSTTQLKTMGDLFRNSGFELTAIKETKSKHAWGLYLKPNQNNRDILSIKEEILLFIVDYEEIQKRTISQALELISADPRLSEQLVLIVAPDQNTSNLIRDLAVRESAIFVGFSEAEISELANAKPNESLLILALQSRLYTKDLYKKVTPIENPRNFYGRRKQLDEVASALVNSNIHIGLFGLRKMGKTSFLYRLIEILQQRFQCYFCYLDMELIDATNPTVEYFLWSLGNAILDSLGRQKIRNLQLLNERVNFFQLENTKNIVQLFVSDMTSILNQTKKVIVIALDEIELMAPLGVMKSSNWESDSFIKIWRVLRGLAQQFPGRLSFFVTGTNPKLIEINRIGKVDNPIYNFFRKDYLRPLPSYDSRELLRDIGKLVGLDWNEDAINLVHKRVGGHPLLLRTYGSLIHSSKFPRSSKMTVTIDDVTEQSQNFMREVNSQLSQMLDVLSDYYEDEYILLELLATGRINEFKKYADEFPEETGHLIGYGLIEYTMNKCEIVVEPLQTLVQRRHNSPKISLKDLSQENDPLIGREINGFALEASIGHVGGFAKVYRAVAQRENQFAAVKILNNGLVSVLQREVDILSEIHHPNIVKMLDSGKTPDGIIYLIMEYLEGNTLKSYCDRTSRLAPEQVFKVTKGLLSALAYFHPDLDVVEKLRAKESLSAQEYAELEMARHGKIHRDIKPENIILTPDRGPVLIDFNISVKASAQMQTQSHTLGYLPPDLLPGQWTPDVDLYQLGITLAQVATGIDYYYSDSEDSNLPDIRNQVDAELPSKLANVILKLCSAKKHQRFVSAKEALNRLS